MLKKKILTFVLYKTSWLAILLLLATTFLMLFLMNGIQLPFSNPTIVEHSGGLTILDMREPFSPDDAYELFTELGTAGRQIPGFKRMIQMFESGADPILNGAPVLLAFHARRTVGFADVNAQLALQNASLVAHALGIEHFFTEWVLSRCRAPMARTWNRRIPSLLGIPPDNNLYGALALGYPIPRFKTMIERKPPLIEWT